MFDEHHSRSTRVFSEMLQRGEPSAEAARIDVTPAERRTAEAALAELCGEPFNNDAIESFLADLRGIRPLNDRVTERIRAFARDGNAFGCLLVRGLPIDDVHGFDKATALSEALLLHIGALTGEPFGYEGQRNGDVVQNIRPRREDAYKLLGTGSAVELIWHTEDAHAERNCDVIALFCLRGDPEAVTLISRIEPDELDDDDVRELERPQYVIRSDESYAGRVTERAVAVLAFADGRARVRYDPPYTHCPTPEAEASLERLTAHINARAIGVTLAAGDVLLIDNQSAVHARTVFRPGFDDTDRWLQRIAIFKTPVPAHLTDVQRRRVIAG